MGTLSEWLASVLTFAAVAVALRESLRGQRSRLVDHELSRRRENLAALSELWAAITAMAMPMIKYRIYFENLPPTFDANKPRTDNDPDATDQPLAFEVGFKHEAFVSLWTQTIEPPLFTALAILHGSALEQPLRDLTGKLRHVVAD
jgi:hypothetical protein